MHDAERDIFSINRPEPPLMTYYTLTSLLLGPFFFLILIPMYFRYHTMRYRFDDQGITMRWGILFRREISLTYARIQDIHLTSNFVERWLGLARIQIQTASGSSSAEMTIEGLRNYESIRDFLYSRMRGAHSAPQRGSAQASGELATLLGEATREIRATRDALERILRERAR